MYDKAIVYDNVKLSDSSQATGRALIAMYVRVEEMQLPKENL